MMINTNANGTVYEVTAKIVGNTKEKIKTIGRENAQFYAKTYLECDEIYAVEITNCFTGEVVYYNSKG
jgi:hypothetical protein